MKGKSILLLIILITVNLHERPTLQEVNEAIASIEECRNIHQWWIDHDDQLTPQQKQIGGSLEWHQHWVDRYNQVLKILYWLQAFLESLTTKPRLLIHTNVRHLIKNR